MFTSRLSRACGLALTVLFLSAGLAALSGGARAQDEKKKAKSKLQILVPQDDADLLIEKKATKIPKDNPSTREFETPELEVGKEYEYAFSVTWRPNNYTTLTREKSITFKGGDELLKVDLTKADPKVADKAVIRWVPTPDDIVQEMIKLGGVKKDDVVFEPGPGDARVLIACVKAGAKKGVGIELDPKKVEEGKENVEKAKLAKEITITEGDALKADYSEATVVMLYMGNEFNNLLRPVLDKQLKPGTRIVSHRFVFGDWTPDKTIKVTGADGDEYVLHLWTVKDKNGGKEKEKEKEKVKEKEKEKEKE
jgi:uncharacterized protein (TIGR03000 family)